MCSNRPLRERRWLNFDNKSNQKLVWKSPQPQFDCFTFLLRCYAWGWTFRSACLLKYREYRNSTTEPSCRWKLHLIASETNQQFFSSLLIHHTPDDFYFLLLRVDLFSSKSCKINLLTSGSPFTILIGSLKEDGRFSDIPNFARSVFPAPWYDLTDSCRCSLQWRKQKLGMKLLSYLQTWRSLVDSISS